MNVGNEKPEGWDNFVAYIAKDLVRKKQELEMKEKEYTSLQIEVEEVKRDIEERRNLIRNLSVCIERLKGQ